jgi:archaellum component FlaF (FlaF/FlaG flagellin family)
MDIIQSPILIIAFNRPEVTRETFKYIEAAKPSILYIAVDGSRENVEGEKQKVDEVKKILSTISWDCDVHYKINSKNLGAEVTVSSAISWVFEKEEFAIILEDDIVAPMSFLSFAQEMLVKYKDHEEIATVTGSNFTPIPFPNNEDYCFAKYGHSWGWATWKRAWQNFDLNLAVDPAHLKDDFLRSISVNDREARYLKKQFSKLIQNGPGNSTWDYTANYFLRSNNKLSIIPRVNLTSNIGVFGLHAKGKTEHHFRKYDEDFKVKNHPKEVSHFVEFDKHHFRNYIYPITPFHIRALRKMRRMLKGNTA